MIVEQIELNRAQYGWTCRMWFAVGTHQAFTWERAEVGSGGRYWFTALWSTYRLARKAADLMRVAPGPYNNGAEAE